MRREEKQLAQRLELSKYDLKIIDTILGKTDAYARINISSNKVIKMLNYIDLCGLCATSNCEMYFKIVNADTDAFNRQKKDKTFHYIALCIDFEKRTVSTMYIHDTDDRFSYKVGD